jgi:hypothetical protein
MFNWRRATRQVWFVLAVTAPRFAFSLISPRGFLFPSFRREKLSHHWTGAVRGCPHLRDEIFFRRRFGFGTAIAVKKEMLFALEFAWVRR